MKFTRFKKNVVMLSVYGVGEVPLRWQESKDRKTTSEEL